VVDRQAESERAGDRRGEDEGASRHEPTYR
jgi:hypothetical protein